MSLRFDPSLPIISKYYRDNATGYLLPPLNRLASYLVGSLPPTIEADIPAHKAAPFRRKRYDIKVVETVPADEGIYKEGEEEEIISTVNGVSHPDNGALEKPLTSNLWLFGEQQLKGIPILLSAKDIVNLLFGSVTQVRFIVSESPLSYILIEPEKNELITFTKAILSETKVVTLLKQRLTELVLNVTPSIVDKRNTRDISNSKDLLFLDDKQLSGRRADLRSGLYSSMKANGAKSDPLACLIADFIVKTSSFPLRRDLKQLADLAEASDKEIQRKKKSSPSVAISSSDQALKRMERTLIKNLLISLSLNET